MFMFKIAEEALNACRVSNSRFGLERHWTCGSSRESSQENSANLSVGTNKARLFLRDASAVLRRVLAALGTPHAFTAQWTLITTRHGSTELRS